MRRVSIKRKCGVDFRLSQRRLWKYLCSNKRCNAPHLDSMGCMHARNVRSHITTQAKSAIRCPTALKTSTFSLKDSAKTLSKYVRYLVNSTTKLKRISKTNNTLVGSSCWEINKNSRLATTHQEMRRLASTALDFYYNNDSLAK